MLRALLLAVLLVPAAGAVLHAASVAAASGSSASPAVETLADLEEPHAGIDKVWEVQVTEEEAGAARALVYRNGPRSPFGLIVYDAGGEEVFAKNGTRGVQSLPALDAGSYRFFVRGTGEFQVTDRTLQGPRTVNGTLAGADAYVLIPKENVTVSFEGNVAVEWLDLTLAAPERLQAPTARTAGAGGVVVMTLRGDDGAPYTIEIGGSGAAAEDIDETPRPGSETPGIPIALVLALVAASAISVKRRT